DLHAREVTGQPEHPRVHARVGDEQVRAEPDRRDREPALRGPGERLVQLVERLGPREGARRPARAERREAGERDVLLDLHPSASSTSGTARSTSPAPATSTTPPAS